MSANPLTQSPLAAQAPPTPHRRRWPKLLAGLVALLLVVVWFAPAVVAKTTLRNIIVRKAAAGLNGTVEVGGASLGWFSPVELRDVVLKDAQGRTVATIPKVTSSKTLFALIRSQTDLGEFTLERPAVDVLFENGTTNLEELFKDDSPPQPTRPQVSVRITDGTLGLRDGNHASELRQLDATVVIPATRSEPITAKLTAGTTLDAEIVAGDTGRVKFVATGFSLETLAPLLPRLEPGLSLAGALTADLTATWGSATTVEGVLGVHNFALTAPWLDGDTLRLVSAQLPLKLAVTGQTIRVERANLTSDVGTVSVTGTFDPDASPEKLFDQAGVKLDASVDLAKLAATLPRLLHIRGGTELREGKLTVKIASTATPDGTTWVGNIDTTALKATRDGHEIRWEEPLSVEFAGRANPGQLPTFDKLVCRSEFIALNAQVSPESVRAAANLDLDKLAARLADFVDLGGITLDGEGSAWVMARRSPTGEFKAEGGAELKKFVLADGKGRELREPTLKFQATATGKATDGRPVTITTAGCTLTAGADELRLKLLDPITDAKQLATGKFDARLAGDLARWRTRVAVVVAIPKHYVFGGTANVHGVVRLAGESVNVDRLTLAIDQARFRGAGLDIDEPQMNAVADLTVNRKTGTTTFENFTIDSAPLSVTKGRLVIAAPENGELVVSGGGPAVVGLNRLGKSLKLYTDTRGPNSLHGKGTGAVHFRYTAGVTTFGGKLDVVNFALGPKNAAAWDEESMRLEADGSYTEATDTLAFKVAKVERPGLALDATGTIAKFDTTTDLDLTGTLTYDMTKLTPKLRDSLGGNFTARGQGTKPISLAGSLTPTAKPGAKSPPGLLAGLKGDFAIGWESIHAYGFEVGPGELRGKLANGLLRVNPLTATFGGGKVTVHPTVRFDPEPAQATFARGLIVDRAKLTPAACAGALGYALPAIAHAGKAEGEVSFTLEDNRIPLADVTKAQLKGQLLIHKATVTAGPVMGLLAQFLGADSTTMTLASDTTVPVRIENGRVYHENFRMKIGGTTVQTNGSVGFDGLLDMAVDMPLPAGLPLFKGTPALAKALAGKRVTMPLRGTLSAPALDPKQFQAAVMRVAEDAAKDVGKDLLHKELEKLFPGIPKK